MIMNTKRIRSFLAMLLALMLCFNSCLIAVSEEDTTTNGTSAVEEQGDENTGTDTGDAGDTSDTGDTDDAGDTSDTGDTDETGDTSDTGDSENASVSLDSAAITLEADSYVYDGSEKTPSVTVTVDGETLTENTHYTVSYSEDNVNAGDVTVTVTAVEGSGYSGSATAVFTITAREITLEWDGDEEVSYDGSDHAPSLIVASGSNELVEGDEISAKFAVTGESGSEAGVDAGTYAYSCLSVTISDADGEDVTGNYSVTVPSEEFELTITACEVYVDITSESVNVTYDGNDHAATDSVAYALYSGTDATGSELDALPGGETFAVAYSGDETLHDAGDTATVSISAYTIDGASSNDNYTVTLGSTSCVVTVVPKEIEVTVTGTMYYNGTDLSEITISSISGLVVTADALISGDSVSDAFLSALTASGSEAGTHAISLENDAESITSGNYTYTLAASSAITIYYDMSEVTVTVTDDGLVYTGSALIPSVTVRYGDTELVEGTDYTLAYTDNTNAGTATVTVTGAGDYSGTASENFTISTGTIDAITIEEGSALSKVYDGDTLLVTSVTIAYTNGNGSQTVTLSEGVQDGAQITFTGTLATGEEITVVVASSKSADNDWPAEVSDTGYTASVSSVEVTDNYDVSGYSAQSIGLSIEAADATIAISVEREYNGSDLADDFADLITAETIVISTDEDNDDSFISALCEVLTISGTDASDEAYTFSMSAFTYGNYTYTLEENSGITITPLEVSAITAIGGSKTYDGKAWEDAEFSVTIGGSTYTSDNGSLTLEDTGDTITVEFTYTDDEGTSTTGEPVDAGSYTVSISAIYVNGSEGSVNYNFPEPDEADVTITAATGMTIAVSSYTKTYDGEAWSNLDENGSWLEGLYTLTYAGVSYTSDANGEVELNGDTISIDLAIEDDATSAGTYTLSATVLYNGETTSINYSGVTTESGTLTVNRATVTITVSGAKVYDGVDLAEDSNFESNLTKVSATGFVGEDTLDNNWDEFTAVLESDGVDVGTYSITMKEDYADGLEEEYYGNYTYILAESSFEITTRHVYIVVSEEKGIGLKDPDTEDWDIVYTGTPGDESITEYGIVDDETVSEALGDDIVEIIAACLDRVDGEAIGTYAISASGTLAAGADGMEIGNYTVHLSENEASVFTITDDVYWTITLGDASVTTNSVSFTIEANDGAELLDDPAEFFSVVTFTATADDTDAAANGNLTYTMPDALTVETETTAYSGTISSDWITYSKTYNEIDCSWTYWLPAGTVITVTATGSDRDGVENTLDVSAETEVETNEISLSISYSNGTTATSSDSATILDENVVIVATDENGNLWDTDYLIVKFGSIGEVVLEYSEESLGYGLNSILGWCGLSGEQDWANTNPAGRLTISVSPLDVYNISYGDTSATFAYDTGAAVSSSGTITNRNDSETVDFSVADTLIAATVEYTYGTSSMTVNGTVNENAGTTSTITWTNGTDWANDVSTLPTTGTITINYTDIVGHTCSLTINVVKATATTQITMRIQPVTDDTVANTQLKLSIVASAYEDLILTINGQEYALGALVTSGTYDSATDTWTVYINLPDEGFEDGEEITFTISYANLEGGSNSITVVFDKSVEEPSLGAELIEGTQAIWGFLEKDAWVTKMTITRAADGTVDTVEVVSGEGYFCSVLLDESLQLGDKVTITVQDIPGNVTTITKEVGAELEPTIAEILGQNIMGVVDDEMEHRFALPLDLETLSANGTLTIPILAYGGIEMGTVTATLNGTTVELQYDITFENALAEDAQARLSVYTEEPTIETLVKGTHATVVESLNDNLTGTLTTIDVSEYLTEEGLSGELWVYAEFDIDMEESSYIYFGGRGVNFYRWIEIEDQTAALIGHEFDVEEYELDALTEQYVTYYISFNSET